MTARWSLTLEAWQWGCLAVAAVCLVADGFLMRRLAYWQRQVIEAYKAREVAS